MPIVAECPACGFKGNVPDQFRGRKVKCRECSQPFVVGGENAAAAVPPVKRKSDPELGNLDFLGNASSAGAGAGPSPFADLDNAAPEPRQAAARARKPNTEDRAPAKKAGAPKRAFKKKADHRGPLPLAAIVLGLLAAVLGVAGLVVRNKGLVGLASVPLSGLGLFLAVGGMVTAMRQPAIGLPAPVLGLLLCLAAITLGGIETYNLIAAGALSESDPAAQRTESTSTEPASSTANPMANGERRPIPVGMPDGTWADPQRGIRLGNAFVRVPEVVVDFVRIRGADPNTSKERRLLIRLEIANLGQQPVDYFGWAVTAPKPGETPPTLTDENGNAIRRIVTEKGQVDGQVDSQTIQPRRAIADLLIFEAPPDRAQHLRLELSATNLDGTGKLRFQIPMTMLLVRSQPKDEPQVQLPPLPPPPPLPPELGKMKGSERVEALRRDLKKPPPQVRVAAASGLGNLGPEAAAAVADLINALREDKSAEVRRACAEALGQIGPEGRIAIPTLTAALRDEFWRVQAAAARSLGQMGPAAKSAIPELLRLTRSKDEEVPNRAKEAIRKIDPNAAIK